MWES